jgi:hypothetical protein
MVTDETNPANPNGHGSYERRDIGAAGVLYFLAGLAVFAVIIHFLVAGIYDVLEKRTEAQQAPVSPLVTNAPKDTRHLPTDYKDYLRQNFPSPQLEVNERDQLDDIRLREEETLNSYGWIDKKAGSVRIPIDRAMDLIAQRGLPTREQPSDWIAVSSAKGKTKDTNKK